MLDESLNDLDQILFGGKLTEKLAKALASNVGQNLPPRMLTVTVEPNSRLKKTTSKVRLDRTKQGSAIVAIETKAGLGKAQLERDILLPTVGRLLKLDDQRIETLRDQLIRHHLDSLDEAEIIRGDSTVQRHDGLSKRYLELNRQCLDGWMPELKYVVLYENEYLVEPTVQRLNYLYVIQLPAGLQVFYRDTDRELLSGMCLLAAFLLSDEKDDDKFDATTQELFEVAESRLRLRSLKEEQGFVELRDELQRKGGQGLLAGLDHTLFTNFSDAKIRDAAQIENEIVKINSVAGRSLNWPKRRYPTQPTTKARQVHLIYDNPKPSDREQFARASADNRDCALLADDTFDEVRAAVATNPRCPKKNLQKLCTDASVRVLGAVAENKVANESMLDTISNTLLKHKKEDYERDTGFDKVAKHLQVGKSTLLRIAHAGYAKSTIAKRPDLDISLATMLRNDESAYVRECIAGNSNVSPELLRELSKDRRKSIRHAVAENPHTPMEVLVRFSHAKDKVLASLARKTVETFSSLD